MKLPASQRTLQPLSTWRSWHESKHCKLVGFFKTDPLHSDLRMITHLFGPVFHCGDIAINYDTNNDSWTIRKEDDFYNLVATYVEQARLSNEIDKL